MAILAWAESHLFVFVEEEGRLRGLNRDVGSIEVAAGVNRRLMWVRKNFLLRTTATAEARAQCLTPKTAPAEFCRWLLDLLFFAKHTHCLSLSN